MLPSFSPFSEEGVAADSIANRRIIYVTTTTSGALSDDLGSISKAAAMRNVCKRDCEDKSSQAYEGVRTMKMKTNMHVRFPFARKCNLGAALMLVLLVATVAHAQLTPSGDAYTNTADPTTNYGAKTLLDVESASQTTYIQFNLSSIPSGYTGADITKATLKLYVNAVTKAGSFNVDYVNGTWSEGTIDANNAPALGSTIVASVPLTTADKNQYVIIDITAALQAWLNGSQANDGVALVGNSPLNASFDSKESTTTSHSAELDIVFVGGGTITGVTTASGSGLMGGGTSGTLSLSLTNACATNQVLQWNGTAWVCVNLKGSGTITGVTAGTDLTGGGTSGNVTLNLDTTKVPLLATSNTFTAGQLISSGGGSPSLSVSNSGGAAGVYSIAAGAGIFGETTTNTALGGVMGVDGSAAGTGTGVYGKSASGTGVYGTSSGGFAVYGNASGSGGLGVVGLSGSNVGVYGVSATDTGVAGFGITGVYGESYVCCAGGGGDFYGFSASSGSDTGGTDGVDAHGGNGDPDNATFGGTGVSALGGGSYYGGIGGAFDGGFGGESGGVGVLGIGGGGPSSDGSGGQFNGGYSSANGDGIDVHAGSGYAGFFYGSLIVTGAIFAGTKDFKIDHPLDPANKYLVHASVESSEMMNIYTGNVTTDAQGEAAVQLPEWFEVLNTDFRYQLTVIGQFAQAIVGRKMENNRFEIRTSAPNVEVSWQVTGVRQDAYAKAHPLVVEEEKDARLKGFYIHPDLYGAPQEKQIEWARHPEMMKQMKAKRGAPPASPLIPRAPVLPLRTTPAVGPVK
jgi:hypothetical protein